MRKASLDKIKALISHIRKNCQNRKDFHSNYYFSDFKNVELSYLINDTQDSLIFLYPSGDFYRLYFATSNLDNLAKLKTSLPEKFNGVLDVVFRNDLPKNLALFLENNFNFHAEFRRYRTSKIKNRKTKVEFAKVEDLDNIYKSLVNNFDKFDSHFPNRNELLNYIEDNNVLVNRTNEGIKGYIIFQIIGSTANFNYLYNNDGNSLSMPRMYSGFFTELSKREVKNVFLWVDEKNISVKEFYLKTGFQADGTIDRIYKF